jgi:hypothetical protein
MTEPQKVLSTTRAHAPCAGVLPPRICTALFAATLSLAPTAGVLAQQPITTSTLTPTVVSASADTSIRPFRVNIPEAKLVDLRRRIAATKWPSRELVSGCIARCTARDDAETRAILGDRLQLA